MSEIVWEAPPPAYPRGGRRDSFAEAIAELRTRPQEWAVLRTYSRKSAGFGTRLKQRHPDCEFTTRTIDGKRVLYGRYIGNGEAT